MRYPHYLRGIDAFGVLALLSATLFAVIPEAQRPTDHIDDLWANLSIEMLGIWVAVRLIDFVIKRNEGSTRTRVRVVRGLRWLERLFSTFHRYQGSHELYGLLRDYRWNEARFADRTKHLKRDEIVDVEVFFRIVRAGVAPTS